MIVGRQSTFVIEAEIDDCIGTWVFGRLRLWLCGELLGYWENAVVLHNCPESLSWLYQETVNRYEPGIWSVPPADIFHLLHDLPMLGGLPDRGAVRDAYSRFVVSDVGIASLFGFRVLLLKDEGGAERCIWNECGKSEVHDCYLAPMAVEDTVREFCSRFGARIARLVDGARPMKSGIRERFAIEADIDDCIDRSIIGKFCFWLYGERLGDWKDAALLNGCVGGLRSFCQEDADWYEPGIWDLDASEVFQLLYEIPMSVPYGEEPVRGAPNRFTLSHLGLSSFEKFDVFLIKSDCGFERCVWREYPKREIHDCRFEPGEMENVARDFCEVYDRRLALWPNRRTGPVV